MAMDTANKADAFTEQVRAMIERLRERLALVEPSNDVAVNDMLKELFAQGKELGLTDKEITQQIIRPVADLLRPGLSR
jgi:hypothetical protein